MSEGSKTVIVTSAGEFTVRAAAGDVYVTLNNQPRDPLVDELFVSFDLDEGGKIAIRLEDIVAVKATS